jgi:hypothetical protein
MVVPATGQAGLPSCLNLSVPMYRTIQGVYPVHHIGIGTYVPKIHLECPAISLHNRRSVLRTTDPASYETDAPIFKNEAAQTGVWRIVHQSATGGCCPPPALSETVAHRRMGPTDGSTV